MKKIFTLLFLVLISGMSYAQWSTDPDVNNLVGGIPTDDVIPKVATAGNGHTYISWFSMEAGNYNVRLQQYDVNGNELFASGGMLISDNTSMSWLTDYNLTVDKDNCAIVGFQDIRNGNNNIHVYRISPDGQMIWGNQGLSLSNNTGFEPYPVMAVPEDNQTVFAWQSEDTTGKGVIRLQKVTPDSTRLWGQWGIIYGSANPSEKYIYPLLVPSTESSVIMFFHKQTGTFTSPKNIYAQKFDVNGAAVWPADVPIYVGSGVPIIPSFCAEPDSAGGAVICWHDTRQGNGLFNVYVQHIDAGGNLLLVAGGQAVTTNSGFTIQMDPSMAYFPSTQEIVTFFNLEDINQSAWGLSGQKIGPAGQLVWGNNMLNLIPLGLTDIEFVEVRKASNQILMTYQMFDFGGFQDSRIYATALDLQGNYVWTPNTTNLCDVQSNKVHQSTGYYQDHQIILAWEDGRNGNPDVYAQNLLINGELGPYAIGIDPIVKVDKAVNLSVFPNPAINNMKVRISGISGKKMLVSVYNITGQKISTLFDGVPASNTLTLDWECTDNSGNMLPPGIYYVEMTGEAGKEAAKVVIK